MTIDLTAALIEALQNPAVLATLKRAVAEVNADTAADAWMGAAQAARHVYGCDGKAEAFRALRKRSLALDAVSVGTGKRRRWKRSDLDQFIRNRAAQ